MAIKRLHPHLHDKSDAVNRFEKEALTVAALDHENIIKVFDFGRAGKSLYLAMPYISGLSLDQWLDRAKGPLPNLAVLSLFRQILSGLQATHSHGVYHRDIKPSNMLIGLEGRVRIADFGIAHLSDGPSITRTGSFLGTPGYAAPEQAEGRPVSDKTDIFSAGSVLYQCLTGRPPFEGASSHAILIGIMQREPIKANLANGKVLPELADLAQAMLAKPMEARPDACACLKRLEAIEACLGIPTDAEWIRRGMADPQAARVAEERLLSERFAERARASRAAGRRREALKLFALAGAFSEDGSALAREVIDFSRAEARRKRFRAFALSALLLTLGICFLLRLGADGTRPSQEASPSAPPMAATAMPGFPRVLDNAAIPGSQPVRPEENGLGGNPAPRPAAARPDPQAGRNDQVPIRKPGKSAPPVPGLSAMRSGKELAVRPSPAPRDSGWLLVKSNPPFAQVRVDEEDLGRTPIISPRRLNPGAHRLELRKDGCLPLHSEVFIRPGETVSVRLSLERDTTFHP